MNVKKEKERERERKTLKMNHKLGVKDFIYHHVGKLFMLVATLPNFTTEMSTIVLKLFTKLMRTLLVRHRCFHDEISNTT
jgi:hypothetical protein